MASVDKEERQFMLRTSRTNYGFTVVELIVGMTIAAFIIIGLFALIITMVNSGSRSIETARQVHATQTAANLIRDDLRLTSRYLITSSISDTRPGGGSWDFRGSGADSRVLVLRTLATNLYKTNDARAAVYEQSGGCPIGTAPAYNNIVYFVRNNNLYRRVIVQPTVAGLYCAGQANGQIRTCENPGSGTPANCAETDVLLAQNVSSFGILYYTRPGDTSAVGTIYDTATTQGSLNAIASIKITLKTTKTIGGENNEYTTEFRATRTGTN